jgi:hypothetical protein
MSADARIKAIEDSLKDQPPLLSIKAASQVLCCSQRQLFRYIQQSRLNTIKLSEGRSTKRIIPRADLVAFLATCAN